MVDIFKERPLSPLSSGWLAGWLTEMADGEIFRLSKRSVTLMFVERQILNDNNS